MKHNIIYTLSAVLAASAVLAGCSSTPKGDVTVSPQAVVLTPNINNDVDLNVTLNVPKGYVSKRSMAKIEPVLVLGNEVVETFDPIVIQGNVYEKKEIRLRKLYGYDPGYANAPLKMGKSRYGINVPLQENIHLSDDFDSGKIQAYITTDGCGECYGVDTVDIAYLSNLSNLIDTDVMLVQWIDTILPPVAKTFEGHGEARLQFEVNKTDILPSLANNAAEMDIMLKALTPVLKDSLSTLNKMSIFGSASAEGRYDKNVALARDRANSAKEWINQRLHLTPRQRNLIKIGSEPEGWGPVIASMHAAGDADSALVKQIVEKYPDIKTGQAERQIRKLKCWPRIAQYHLAKDRRVIYNYEWTIKSFDTDEEVVAMFRKRPDALSIPEYFRVARLVEENNEGDDQVIDVYETMLKYFPNNKIAINNLAVLYFDNERYADAKRLLEGQPILTDDMTNTLALCYKETGDIDNAIALLNGVDTDKARYNLGSLLASTHRMAEAYDLLRDADDLNAAVTALGVDKAEESWSILERLDDDSPKADYVRAIAKARLGYRNESIKYLKHAVKDAKLKARAATEADFITLQNEPEFIKLINE